MHFLAFGLNIVFHSINRFDLKLEEYRRQVNHSNAGINFPRSGLTYSILAVTHHQFLKRLNGSASASANRVSRLVLNHGILNFLGFILS